LSFGNANPAPMTNEAADTDEVGPFMFHIGAMRFLIAGDDLFDRRKRALHPVQEPQYVLYAHAMELSLKAYLRQVGVSTAKLSSRSFGHDIGRLYDEALARGLDPLPEHAEHFKAVTHLTAESNRVHFFRYWNRGTIKAPRIDWLRAVTHLLMERVAHHLARGGLPVGGSSRSKVFGPENYGLPVLPQPPLRKDGPWRDLMAPSRRSRQRKPKATDE
jgi:hypothetical protein